MFNYCCSCLQYLETIKVLAITFTKNVLKAFWINFCLLLFEVFSIVQVIIAVHFIQTFERISVGLLLPDFIIFRAIQCIRDTTLTTRLCNHFWGNVIPGVTDPSVDLIQLDLANKTSGSKAVLSSQHPVLPLSPRAVREGFVDGHIQRLKHAGHATRNHYALCVNGP